MSLNNLNKESGVGESISGNFEPNVFGTPPVVVSPEGATGASSGENTEILSELEKMAAQELQQKIDEGKRTWKYQTQLTLVWQHYLEETEQIFRRKVEQIRNAVRAMDKTLLLERRFSAPAASAASTTSTSSVNYYPKDTYGETDKVGTILMGPGNLELPRKWTGNPRGYMTEKENRGERLMGGGVKINIVDEEGNEKSEISDESGDDDTEIMIK